MPRYYPAAMDHRKMRSRPTVFEFTLADVLYYHSDGSRFSIEYLSIRGSLADDSPAGLFTRSCLHPYLGIYSRPENYSRRKDCSFDEHGNLDHADFRRPHLFVQ
jgi:hypothetical protein